MHKNRRGEVAPKLEEGPRNHQERKMPKKEIMKMRWKRLWGRNKGPEGGNQTRIYLESAGWH